MIITLIFRLRKLWAGNKSQGKSLPGKILGTIYSILWRLLIFLLLVAGLWCAKKYGPAVRDAQDWAKQTAAKSKSEDFQPSEGGTKIYDATGNLIAQYSDGSKAAYLVSSDIPDDVKNAFIAIEDRTFYKNPGFDVKGMARVVYRYLRTHGIEAHGASTITQQLARMTYLTNEKSMDRKVKEIFLSYYLSQKYSKNEILEFYVNKCCFANNIYGIQAAAQAYFGIDAKDLTLDEVAYLCAIPNRPEYYNPWKVASNAIDRRDKILKDMYECEFISLDEERNALKADTVSKIIPEKVVDTAAGLDTVGRYARSYMKSFATQEVCKWQMQEDGFQFQYDFNNDDEYAAYKESYKEAYEIAYQELAVKPYEVHTSLNYDVCRTLQEALDTSLSKFSSVGEDGLYDVQGSMTVVDNETGLVIGLVGGRSQDGVSSQLNRACQSYRQPGSSIKPLIVYTPGLMRGYEPDSMLTEVSVEAANSGKGMTDGPKMTLRRAVEQSKNGCAYYLFNDVTPTIGLSFIQKMNFAGIASSDKTLSAALGGLTYGTNTVEMAGAYHALVNQGTFTAPTCILSICDENAGELYQEPQEQAVYYKRDSAQMIDIMQGVITSGTARKMKWDMNNIAAAGKTGTTNDSKDGWFCGVTPYYTMTVWVGADTPESISGMYGGTYPMNAWKTAMMKLLEGKEPAQFDLSHESDQDIFYRTAEETRQLEFEKDEKTSKTFARVVDKSIDKWLQDYVNAQYGDADERVLEIIREKLSHVEVSVTTADAMQYVSDAKILVSSIRLAKNKKLAEELISNSEHSASEIDIRARQQTETPQNEEAVPDDLTNISNGEVISDGAISSDASNNVIPQVPIEDSSDYSEENAVDTSNSIVIDDSVSDDSMQNNVESGSNEESFGAE